MPLYYVDFASLEEFLDVLSLCLASTRDQMELHARLMRVRLRLVLSKMKRMVLQKKRGLTKWSFLRTTSDESRPLIVPG